jgi:single-strand DNA-binding protein
MTIPVRQGLEGVFETTFQPGETKNGKPVLRAWVRITRWQRNDDGSFTQLDSGGCDLVVFDQEVADARLRFRVGDTFVASGRVNTYSAFRGGRQVQREEFIAHRLGHDAATTEYRVVRTHRRRKAAARRRTAARRQGLDAAPLVAGRILPDGAVSRSAS